MRTITMSAVGVAAVLLSVATTTRADDSKSQPMPATSSVSTTTTTSADTPSTPTGTMTPPPSRETTTLRQAVRPNKAYLYTGGGLFLGSYVTTAVVTGVAANEDKPTVDRNLYIPVVGPWIHLANDARTESNSTGDTLLVVGSGIAQGAGIGLIIASFFIPEHVDAATIQAGNVRMNVTPMAVGRGGSGIGAVGTF
jgi:hypothetical protein